MKTDTFLVHGGRASARLTQSVNPPLVRASTVTFESLAAYKAAHHERVFDAPRYGRSGTATTFELQRAMAALSRAETCIATSSGLSALTAVLGAHAGPGRHLLVSDGVYGPTRTFCERELAAAGTDVEFFSSACQLQDLMRDTTCLVFIESPASLTMEMLDVRAVCDAARQRGVPVACDATWGTPLFFDAHGLGVDIAIHSATKYINGHSDVMLGLITGSLKALTTTRAHCDRIGTHAAPDACWLALRGLRTLSVRLQRHQQTALAVATWLQAQAQVRQVLFPALPSDPGHELWRRQFTGAPGPFSFELVPCSEDRLARFIDGLRLFTLGTSWGGFESLVIPAVPYSQRHLDVLPDAGRLVRLHVGLEDAEDLKADLSGALAAFSA